MKRSPIRLVRKTLRRGEPTKAEKEAARAFCCDRAGGKCEMPFPHGCPIYVPLKFGQLAHFKAKRRFGWFESEVQRHLWSCVEGHRLQHAYGWSGVKPVPAKLVETCGATGNGDVAEMTMTTPIMKSFEFSHLPTHLQGISGDVYALACSIDAQLPDGPEKSEGLRRLLEAKDCFVRAKL